MSEVAMCTSQAQWRRFWPGKAPDIVCDAHADDTRAIAEAIGCAVHLERIQETGEEPDLCVCSAGHPQRVPVG